VALRELSLLSVALLFVGLVAIFSGEHAFAHTSFSTILTWLGIIAVTSAVGMRGWATIQSDGAHRKIEMISAACNMGVLIALLGYYLTTQSGMDLFAIEAEATVERWKMVMTVIWVIVLVVALVPLVMVTIVRSTGRSDAETTVDLMQVREMASSGLSIALAAAFLMVTCNIADQRNIRRDVSYFKTSSPGPATVRMLNSLNEPLRVIAFFPEDNEVAAEVKHYFDALGLASANLEYEERDRLINSGLAKEHKVSQEGTIVLVRGDASKKFTISTDYNAARAKALREFDGEFQKSLMAVLRDTKTAYFSVGHGELNDPKSAGALNSTGPLLKSTLIKSALKQLNYKAKDYEGFGKPVPDDCSILFVLAPRVALIEDELRAIDDYLARGGAAIFSFDPDAEMRLGPIQKRLGVAFNPTPIADDKEFMVRTRTISDHSLILTNQFQSHASISTMARGNARAAILFVRPGSFDELELSPEQKSTTRSQIVRTMQTAFRDIAGSDETPNFTFDEKSEKRDRYTIAMAVENPDARPANLPEGASHNGMRVVLLADREVLSDGILARVAVVQNMLVDIIKWTGGEEAFSGETSSEKDKRIEHSRSQDAIWFYLTILAAPTLVLVLGLLYVGRRRSRFVRQSRSAKRSAEIVVAAAATVESAATVASESADAESESPEGSEDSKGSEDSEDSEGSKDSEGSGKEHEADATEAEEEDTSEADKASDEADEAPDDDAETPDEDGADKAKDSESES
jgi:hypothetical protein